MQWTVYDSDFPCKDHLHQFYLIGMIEVRVVLKQSADYFLPYDVFLLKEVLFLLMTCKISFSPFLRSVISLPTPNTIDLSFKYTGVIVISRILNLPLISNLTSNISFLFHKSLFSMVFQVFII